MVVSEKFILMSLEEGKAKKLAKVINSNASRKILDLLAEKDYTESEISEKLDIPISTVHYNIKALEDAGLIEVNEYHYSEKGREVNHYSLANKYVIIAPKKDVPGIMDKLKSIIPSVLIVGIGAFLIKLFSNTYYNGFYSPKISDSQSIPLTDMAKNSASDMIVEESTRSTMSQLTLNQEYIEPTSIASPFSQKFDYFLSEYSTVLWIILALICVVLLYILFEWLRKRKHKNNTI